MKRIFTEAQKKANCKRARIWYQENTARAKKRIVQWTKENPDRVKASRKRRKKQISEGKKRWYRANKEHVKVKSSKWAKRNPLIRRKIAREWHLFVKYEFTQSDFDSLLKKQSRRCAICRNSFRTRRKTFIDHCHYTGKIRGLLCPLCNAGLGMFKDSPKNLIQAVKYLKL